MSSYWFILVPCCLVALFLIVLLSFFRSRRPSSAEQRFGETPLRAEREEELPDISTVPTAELRQGAIELIDEELEGSALPLIVEIMKRGEATKEDIYRRGLIHDFLQEYELVIQYCSEAILLDPEYVDAYILRSRGYIDMEQDDLALADFAKVLEVNPDCVDALSQRSYFYYDLQKQFDKAIEDYTELIRLQPDEVSWNLKRGLAHRNLGKFNLAAEDFSECIRKEPSGEAYGHRALIKLAQKDYTSAIVDLTDSIRWCSQGGDMPRLALDLSARSFAHFQMEDMVRGEEDLLLSFLIDSSFKHIEEGINLGFIPGIREGFLRVLPSLRTCDATMALKEILLPKTEREGEGEGEGEDDEIHELPELKDDYSWKYGEGDGGDIDVPLEYAD